MIRKDSGNIAGIGAKIQNVICTRLEIFVPIKPTYPLAI